MMTVQSQLDGLLANYARLPITLVDGNGSRVWDASGREYIDFFTGIAVNNLGHRHPAIVAAIEDAARKPLHFSNWFEIPAQRELGRLLALHGFAEAFFFCNSGAEANEAALKLARLYGQAELGGAYEFIAFQDGFHGRTFATMSVTGQEKIHGGFGPLMPGVHFVPRYDLSAIEDKLKAGKVCAIILEIIQGESGGAVPTAEQLRSVVDLAHKYGALAIFDEIQTGMARLGTLFGYQAFGVEPDIITLAKGLGAGVPIGAMGTTEKIGKLLSAGKHGSTFAGNPFVCSIARAAVEVYLSKDFLDGVLRRGELCRARFSKWLESGKILGYRGMGLWWAIELEDRNGVAQRSRDNGVLTIPTKDTMLRILPSLVIPEDDLSRGLSRLEAAL